MAATKTEREHLRGPIAHGVLSVDNQDAGIIRGYSVTTRGEALGHGFFLDDVFLDKVVALGNQSKKGIKTRFGHPAMSGDAIGTFLGRSVNFRRDGDCVRADLVFSPSSRETPNGDLGGYVMKLAASDPEHFGASIVFTRDFEAEAAWEKEHGKRGDKLITARIAHLHASDVVDEPAANPNGILSEGAVFFSTPVKLSAEVSAFLDKFVQNAKAVDAAIAFLKRYQALRDEEDEDEDEEEDYNLGDNNKQESISGKTDGSEQQMQTAPVSPPAGVPVEKLGVIQYRDYGIVDDLTAPWDGPKETASADTDELFKMCTWYDEEKKDVKESYKLPHHRSSDLKAVWRGVRAAMGALLGSRGGVQIPETDKKGCHEHLSLHYIQFDKEPPDLRAYSEAELSAMFPDEEEPNASVQEQHEQSVQEQKNEETGSDAAEKQQADREGRMADEKGKATNEVLKEEQMRVVDSLVSELSSAGKIVPAFEAEARVLLRWLVGVDAELEMNGRKVTPFDIATEMFEKMPVRVELGKEVAPAKPDEDPSASLDDVEYEKIEEYSREHALSFEAAYKQLKERGQVR